MLVINQLNLKDKIKLVGHVPHKDIVPFYEKADLYIQYSLDEGFCNAVLEAQSMGVLTVVSDALGLSENVVDGETGWIVPKRKPSLLARKIEHIISMEDKKINIIRLNAIERVQNKFNLNRQKKYFDSFFNENSFQNK